MAVDSLEEMQELLPGEYDYVIVRNYGTYYWNYDYTTSDNSGTILRIEDTCNA
jgi:hypothetical protein